MIGTNNTGHRMQPAHEVAKGVQTILGILAEKCPQSHVVLHGVFPRGASEFDPARLNNVAINQHLQKLADGRQVHYQDLSSLFLEEDKTIRREIMPDLLHLSPAGYRIWADALEPKLKELGL